MRQEAHRRAHEIGINSDNVHHILPIRVARKYDILREIVRSQENAIALEQPFHKWIEDTFTEADYIFIAEELFGLKDEDFQLRKIRRPKRNKSNIIYQANKETKNG